MAAEPGSCLLVQFAREPVAGAVKTRMMPHLSATQASELHSELVLWTCATLTGTGLAPVELAVAGDTAHLVFERCRAMGVAGLYRQQGADLGERMYNALAAALGRCERVVLVGSDCPAIDRNYLRQALGALEEAELVLGPALDGGYVLIGARRIEPGLFTAMPWGTDRVYDETVRRLERLDMRWQALPALADIDRPGDLPEWRRLRGSGGGELPG